MLKRKMTKGSSNSPMHHDCEDKPKTPLEQHEELCDQRYKEIFGRLSRIEYGIGAAVLLLIGKYFGVGG